MSKNAKDVEKRRQKKIAKQKASRGVRVAAYKAEQAQKAAYRKKLQEARELTKGAVSLPPLSEEDYIFWLCHGANYLASDSDQGVWSPLFEDIYQGQLPQPESIAQKVLLTYHAELEAKEKFDGIPRAVLAWTVTSRQVVTVYKHEAIRRLKAQDAGCDAEALARRPHNPVVWAMMDQVKARSLAAGARMDAEATTPDPVEEPLAGDEVHGEVSAPPPHGSDGTADPVVGGPPSPPGEDPDLEGPLRGEDPDLEGPLRGGGSSPPDGDGAGDGDSRPGDAV